MWIHIYSNSEQVDISRSIVSNFTMQVFPGSIYLFVTRVNMADRRVFWEAESTSGQRQRFKKAGQKGRYFYFWSLNISTDYGIIFGINVHIEYPKYFWLLYHCVCCFPGALLETGSQNALRSKCAHEFPAIDEKVYARFWLAGQPARFARIPHVVIMKIHAHACTYTYGA